MRVFGLTGGIGTGKTTTANLFRKLGLPVFDSDAEVHRLMEEDPSIIASVDTEFPGAVQGGKVDRAKLSDMLLTSHNFLGRIEAIVYPTLFEKMDAFLKQHARAPIVVLDIPLLYEKNLETRCDYTLCMTAGPEVQKQRVMSRSGMNDKKFELLMSAQLPLSTKISHSDFALSSEFGEDYVLEHLIRYINIINGYDRLGVAVYPGTFDPITLGHLDIIRQAAAFVTTLIIGIAEDTGMKNPIFSAAERVALVSEEIKPLVKELGIKIEVKPYSGLTVDFVNAHDATVMIRGLRSTPDFEYEVELANNNARIDPTVKTLFLIASENGSFISSTRVRSLAHYMKRNPKTLKGLVSDHVQKALTDKLGS